MRAWPDTAFVVGGTGTYGKSDHVRKCLAFAESLVRIGGWAGPVYILNDDRDETLSLGANQTTRLIKVPAIGKEVKTWVFDSPAVTESTVIFHDCDVVVAKADCIAERLGHPLDFTNFDFYLAEVEGIYTCITGVGSTRCGDKIHTGTFAANRKTSRAILTAWQAHMRSLPGSLDRYTLYSAIQELNATAATPPRIGRLPQRMSDSMWYPGKIDCMNHMSKGRLKDERSWQAAGDFIRSLCIEPAREGALLDRLSRASIWQEYARDVRGEVMAELRWHLLSHPLRMMGLVLVCVLLPGIARCRRAGWLARNQFGAVRAWVSRYAEVGQSEL